MKLFASQPLWNCFTRSQSLVSKTTLAVTGTRLWSFVRNELSFVFSKEAEQDGFQVQLMGVDSSPLPPTILPARGFGIYFLVTSLQTPGIN